MKSSVTGSACVPVPRARHLSVEEGVEPADGRPADEGPGREARGDVRAREQLPVRRGAHAGTWTRFAVDTNSLQRSNFTHVLTNEHVGTSADNAQGS